MYSPANGDLTSVDTNVDVDGELNATLTVPSIDEAVFGGIEVTGNDTAAEFVGKGMFAHVETGPGPCALEDEVSITVGETVTIPVLDNDEGDALPATVELVVPPDGDGSIDPATGGIVYTPLGDFIGTDSFTYRACDDDGRCDSAHVTVTVDVDCSITGTLDDDTLIGTDGDDVICGVGGNNTIYGGGGNDMILGGPGHDLIFPGPGANVVFGGRGDDYIYLGAGDNTVDGGSGYNHVAQSDDAIPPTISMASPSDGGEYELDESVTADYTCSDDESGVGVARCLGPVASGGAIDTTTPGSHTFEVLSLDWAGNIATTTVTYEVSPP